MTDLLEQLNKFSAVNDLSSSLTGGKNGDKDSEDELEQQKYDFDKEQNMLDGSSGDEAEAANNKMKKFMGDVVKEQLAKSMPSYGENEGKTVKAMKKVMKMKKAIKKKGGNIFKKKKHKWILTEKDGTKRVS